MPKAINSTSKHENAVATTKHKHKYEPYTKKNHDFDKAFHDFSQNHKKDLKSTKLHLKQLCEENKVTQSTTLEQKEIIQNLKQILANKEKEIAKQHQEQEALKEENKMLKTKCEELEQKFVALETTYDRELGEKQEILENYKHNIKMLKDEQDKQLKETAEQIKNLQENLQEKSMEISVIKKELLSAQNMMKNHAEQNTNNAETLKALELTLQQEKENITRYEHEICDLKEQLQLKENEIENLQHQKQTIEETKNHVIDEFAYKLRQVERLLDQPVTSVQPQSIAVEHFIAHEPMLEDEIPNTNHTTTTSFRENIDNKSKAAKKSNRQQAQRQSQQSQLQQQRQNSTNDQKGFGTLKRIERRFSHNSNIDTTNNNGFSSDDESSIGWHPEFPLNNSRNTERVHGFILRRRTPFQENLDDVYISSTSESGPKKSHKSHKSGEM